MKVARITLNQLLFSSSESEDSSDDSECEVDEQFLLTNINNECIKFLKTNSITKMEIFKKFLKKKLAITGQLINIQLQRKKINQKNKFYLETETSNDSPESPLHVKLK